MNKPLLEPTQDVKFANAWQRLFASIIDFLLIGALLYVADIAFFKLVALYAQSQNVNYHTDTGIYAFRLCFGLTIHFLLWIGFFVAFETSKLRATPGKLILNIRILRNDKTAVSRAISLVRNIYKLLPIAVFQCIGVAISIIIQRYYATLQPSTQTGILSESGLKITACITLSTVVISFVLILFTKQRQSLHDLLAGTIVVKTGENAPKAMFLKLDQLVRKLKRARIE